MLLTFGFGASGRQGAGMRNAEVRRWQRRTGHFRLPHHGNRGNGEAAGWEYFLTFAAEMTMWADKSGVGCAELHAGDAAENALAGEVKRQIGGKKRGFWQK